MLLHLLWLPEALQHWEQVGTTKAVQSSAMGDARMSTTAAAAAVPPLSRGRGADCSSAFPSVPCSPWGGSTRSWLRALQRGCLSPPELHLAHFPFIALNSVSLPCDTPVAEGSQHKPSSSWAARGHNIPETQRA